MAKKTKKLPLRNNIIIVFDNSGSMSICQNDAQNAINEWIDEIKKNASQHKQKTLISLVKFGQYITTVYSHQDLNKVEHITDYSPREHYTRLFDAVKYAIEEVEKTPSGRYDDSFLVLTISDGQDNYSYHPNTYEVPSSIRSRLSRGNWTFTFACPPNTRSDFARKFGISTDNIYEWNTNDKTSVKRMSEVTSQGLSQYYGARASGARSVTNFYTANLNNLKTSSLKKLDDIQDECDVFTVPKEMAIKEFVEKKTRKPYRIGSAYYQLSKRELVQGGKDLLIMPKGKSQIFAGSETRHLIGLPSGVDIKIDPGNLGGYDLFIASTSVNRKLVRGTRVIVRNI